MKLLIKLLILALTLPIIGVTQVPQKFSYQAAVRNADGSMMTEQEIDLKVILRTSTLDGDIVYEENHAVTTSPQGLIAIEVGNGDVVSGVFSEVPWSHGIFIQLDIKEVDQPTYATMGVSQILSVPYALRAGNAVQGDGSEGQTIVHNGDAWAASSRMSVNLNTVEVLPEVGRDPEEPLFSVRNSDGQLVFAVYESGTRVYVDGDEGAKGSRGGFAVGGLSDQGKKGAIDYLTILPDSVKFNILQPLDGKGFRGGFAVGGLSDQGKQLTHNFFTLKSDSAKFVLKNDQVKGFRGGFAVGGLSDQGKGYTNYITINDELTSILNNLSASGDVMVMGDMLTGGNIGTLPITDVDGNVYQTVMIGTQVWMRQNLRTTKYSDGSLIEDVVVTFNPAGESSEVYGNLYGQSAITNPAGLCPTGWHVPTQVDWEQLFWTVAGESWATNQDMLVANLLDNSGIWEGGAIIPTNSSGFTAVPSGYGYYSTGNWIYGGFNVSSYYWIAGGLGELIAYQIDNQTGFNEIYEGDIQTPSFSVRCIKNPANIGGGKDE